MKTVILLLISALVAAFCRQQVKTAEIPVLFEGYQQTVSLTEPTDFSKLAEFAKHLGNFFLNGENETEEAYVARVLKFVDETKLDSRPLSKSSVLLSPTTSYDTNAQRFSMLLNIPGTKSVQIVERKSGVYQPDLKVVSFEMPKKSVNDFKTEMGLLAVGFPVGTAENDDILFFPTKYIVYNKNTGEIYKRIGGNKLK